MGEGGELFHLRTDFQFRVEDHDFLRRNEEVHFGRWLRFSFRCLISSHRHERKKARRFHSRSVCLYSLSLSFPASRVKEINIGRRQAIERNLVSIHIRRDAPDVGVCACVCVRLFDFRRHTASLFSFFFFFC